jgi:hypothetical protein
MTAIGIVGLLADPTRLRVFAAVVLGSSTAERIATTTGAPIRDVLTALRRLSDGGLVTTVDGAVLVRTEALREAARVEPRDREPQDPDAARDAVLRAFIVDGRLTGFPAVRSKRRIVLEHIVAAFEPGVRYPEREVDAILRAWHDDHAALRRYLVDAELLTRDRNVYWRIGGPTA